MNIVLITASTNKPSNSIFLADAFIEGMQEDHEIKLTTVDLSTVHLQQFTIDMYPKEHKYSPEFLKIKDALEACDAFVIATPIWNFGVPAHLKNVIDYIGSFALEKNKPGSLYGKLFYIIFTGGAPMTAWKAMLHKTVSSVKEGIKYFGCSYMGCHFEPRCTAGTGIFRLVVDQRPESREVIKQKGKNFGAMVAEYVRTGKAPLKNRTQNFFMRLGEKILKKIG